jgi:hypothetical protein
MNVGARRGLSPLVAESGVQMENTQVDPNSKLEYCGVRGDAVSWGAIEFPP